MTIRLSTMLWLSAAIHGAVLAPAYFADIPLAPAAPPMSISLSTPGAAPGEHHIVPDTTPPSIATRPAPGASSSAIPIEAAASDRIGMDAGREPGLQTANHLRAFLTTQLERYFVYPTLARRRGWQGEVGVSLRIEPDGRVRALRVARSSGYAVLDRDALATLNRIGVLPRAASWLNGQAYDTEIPVIYRLTEG